MKKGEFYLNMGNKPSIRVSGYSEWFMCSSDSVELIFHRSISGGSYWYVSERSTGMATGVYAPSRKRAAEAITGDLIHKFAHALDSVRAQKAIAQMAELYAADVNA